MINTADANQSAVVDDVRRLAKAMNDLDARFREQRALLQKQGMSLPPGTLQGLQQVRTELEALVIQFEETTTELQRLRALSRTAEVINSTLSLTDVLNEVMDTVISLTKAERGYLMLHNDETGAMEFRVARKIEARNLAESEFIVSNTVVGEVARTGQPVLTMNAGQDPRFSSQISIVSQALRSILCVPLLLKGQVTGVIYADNRIRQGLFGDKELQLLQAFANQSAVAIENARLFERLQASLAEITKMRDLLDNVFASIASGVITTDAHDQITRLNNAACQILTLSQEVSVGRVVWEALPPIDSELSNMVRSVRQKNAEHNKEIEPELPPRGTVNLSLKLSPLKDADQVTQGAAIVVDDLTALKQREAQLNVVRRYLPPAMVDNIQSIDRLGLGGERRLVTTVFIDVRGFNTFPATLHPRDLMEMLNVYLTIAAEAVTQQAGVIDKYMASELMGLFNTQINPAEDHVWRAILSILNMADEFAEFYRQSGESTQVGYYRVGIHAGVATLGNVGSETRKEFTAIGDAINLAHRLLENAAPGQIVISEDTLGYCQTQYQGVQNRIRLIGREELHVKGRAKPVWVHRITRA